MKSIFKGLITSAIVLASSTSYAVETINGAGATFPYPVYSAWAFEYSKTSGNTTELPIYWFRWWYQTNH